MAAASAADGRNALALAPSLPRHPLLAAPSAKRPRPGEQPERVAEAVASLSHLVAERLAQAATWTLEDGDQAACNRAARSARDICGLLTSSP